MATAVQTRVLSTPAMYVSGILIKVVPNSVTMMIPGEVNVRAMSAGGGVVEIVAGVNAEKLVGDVKFDIANTAENIELARGWRNDANNGLYQTLRLVELTAQYSFDQMFLSNEPEVMFKSDGNMKIEFKGRFIP